MTLSKALAWCILVGATGGGACQQSTHRSSADLLLGGTVTNLGGPLFLTTGAQTVGVRKDGAFSFAFPLRSGDAYEVTVKSQPPRQVCTVEHGSGHIAADTHDITVTCTEAPLSERHTYVQDQAVSFVVGQPDLGGDAGEEVPGNDPLAQPWGKVALSGDIFYVPDTGHCRVLGYNSLPTQLGAKPDFTLGGADLNSSCSQTMNPLPTNFGAPQDIIAAAGKVAVLDFSYNRVLIFNAPPTAEGTPADVAVGQPATNASVSGCKANRLLAPNGLTITPAGRLIVSDGYNNRVLIWNSVPSQNDVPADLVLGQPSFTNCGARPADANTLHNPAGVWSDDTHLAVTDVFNHRVMLWNTFPTVNNQPADAVLGRAGPQDRSDPACAGARVSTLCKPTSVFFDGKYLYVADFYNNRIALWEGWPTASGAAPDLFLGQPDATSRGWTTGKVSLGAPEGVVVLNNRLYVSDNTSNRIAVFEPL